MKFFFKLLLFLFALILINVFFYAKYQNLGKQHKIQANNNLGKKIKKKLTKIIFFIEILILDDSEKAVENSVPLSAENSLTSSTLNEVFDQRFRQFLASVIIYLNDQLDILYKITIEYSGLKSFLKETQTKIKYKTNNIFYSESLVFLRYRDRTVLKSSDIRSRFVGHSLEIRFDRLTPFVQRLLPL